MCSGQPILPAARVIVPVAGVLDQTGQANDIPAEQGAVSLLPVAFGLLRRRLVEEVRREWRDDEPEVNQRAQHLLHRRLRAIFFTDRHETSDLPLQRVVGGVDRDHEPVDQRLEPATHVEAVSRRGDDHDVRDHDGLDDAAQLRARQMRKPARLILVLFATTIAVRNVRRDVQSRYARSGVIGRVQSLLQHLGSMAAFERRAVDAQYYRLSVLPDRGAFSCGVPLAANRLCVIHFFLLNLFAGNFGLETRSGLHPN